MEDKVIEAVCQDLKRRSDVGIKKYGVTLERTDLTLEQWLGHAYEEALDMANYLSDPSWNCGVNCEEVFLQDILASN